MTRISRLLILVLVLKLPICIVSSPLLLGLEVITPSRFMLNTLTCVPTVKSHRLCDLRVLAVEASGLIASFDWFFFILSRSAERWCSSSLTVMPCLFIVLMVSSAYSLASRRILAASSLAFLIILSVRSSSLSDFFLSCAFSCSISDL